MLLGDNCLIHLAKSDVQENHKKVVIMSVRVTGSKAGVKEVTFLGELKYITVGHCEIKNTKTLKRW